MNQRTLVAVLCLAGAAGVTWAQSGAQPSPPQAATGEQAIHADPRTYEAMQKRIEALRRGPAAGGAQVADYALSKAQCWLDVSLHEYTRNDRSAFPQGALAQAGRIVKAIEDRAAAPADTPLVNDAARLRPDLWLVAERLKSDAGHRCAAPLLACAEVDLVHAGNEFQQLGWRHARPYVQMAEDRLAEAQAAAQRCR